MTSVDDPNEEACHGKDEREQEVVESHLAKWWSDQGLIASDLQLSCVDCCTEAKRVSKESNNVMQRDARPTTTRRIRTT